MAIKRTVDLNNTASQKAALKLTYSLPRVGKVEKSAPAENQSRSNEELFGYSTALIYQDIFKTIIVSVVTLGILALITLKARIL